MLSPHLSLLPGPVSFPRGNLPPGTLGRGKVLTERPHCGARSDFTQFQGAKSKGLYLCQKMAKSKNKWWFLFLLLSLFKYVSQRIQYSYCAIGGIKTRLHTSKIERSVECVLRMVTKTHRPHERASALGNFYLLIPCTFYFPSCDLS